MTVLSLGWGVQSFTLAAMSALDELPKVDYAIHADTMHERTATYEFAAKMTPWLTEKGITVLTVRSDHTALQRSGMIMIPARTDGEKGGQQKRMCTGDWKLDPMRREMSRLLKVHGLKKYPGVVEQWIGISYDESERQRPSGQRYIVNRWPLLERWMTRYDCERWLQDHGLPVPAKSACVFCPYRDDKTWLELQREQSCDFEQAQKADAFIRKARPPYDLYLHRKLKPLGDIDFRSEAERSGQLSLWQDECTGLCGV